MEGADCVLSKRRPSTAPGGTTDALPRPPRPRWVKRILMSWVLSAHLPPLVTVPDLRPATSTHWFRAAGLLNGGPREADVRTPAHRCIELRIRSLRAPGPRPTLALTSDVLVTCVDEALGLQHGKTSSLVKAGAVRSAPRVDSTDPMERAPPYAIYGNIWISKPYFYCLFNPCLAALRQLPSSAGTTWALSQLRLAQRLRATPD